ncbi:MAG TPA: DeoR/GlpR family DNA-binding transcription regulator [Spirochaetia bacterium]|nr:DeoR/GlpR family DNA-binding transcription regulator [Spirochaetia bacterium]
MEKDQMFAEERKVEIVEYVNHQKKATVGELCERFKVSGATIRNDLRELEHSRLLIRTHGGAMINSKTGFELVAKDKEVQNLDLKQRIARAAMDYIEDGDTIVVDTGSTTIELVKLLIKKNKHVTVVTNDLVIAMELEESPNMNIVLVGGKVRKKYHCTVGALGKDMLKGLTVDKAFMAANSFSPQKGATTPDLQQAEMKTLMLGLAAKVYLLADSTKIGKNSFAQFAPVEQIDCLITDSISKADRQAFEELGLEIIIAP